MYIRKLKSSEAALFRDLRLQALANAPNSFGETLEQAEAQPNSYWQKLTESVTKPDGHIMFLAEQLEQVVGFAFGLRDRQDSKVGHLGGMWVNPNFRSQGVGYGLVEAIIAWGHQLKQERLELWVTEGNRDAIRLYERVGFIDTSKRDILPSNPSLQIIQMALQL